MRMNLLASLLLLAGTVLPGIASAQAAGKPEPACPALLNQQFQRLQDDAPQNLCQYAGKVALVVNTASYCGYTSQYEGLEALYAKYRERGLVVLGFPSNDFGAQEPGNSRQIADFCFNTYGVRFPMFAKTTVVGPAADLLARDGEHGIAKVAALRLRKECQPAACATGQRQRPGA